MTVTEAAYQIFYRGEDVPPVNEEDVMLLVDGNTDEIRKRFKHVRFLPWVLDDAERKLTMYRVHGFINRDEELRLYRFFNSEECRFNYKTDRNEKDTYLTASMFARTAFELFELLQNVEEHPVTKETVERFGGSIEDEGTTERFSFSFEVPPCDYMQFVADGCERLEKEPFWCDCILRPTVEGEGDSPLVGWTTCTHSAILTYCAHIPKTSKNKYQLALSWLLKFLLDLHLSDTQLVTHGIGEQVLVAPHALGAIWITMREKLAGGRAGVCRVCGKRFIAHDERKEKARYCTPRGACQQAYMRTKKVLSLVNAGNELADAAKQVSGISAKRAASIALRNQHVLQVEFQNVDFATLAERS